MRVRALALLLSISAIAAACGGGGDDGGQEVSTETTTGSAASDGSDGTEPEGSTDTTVAAGAPGMVTELTDLDTAVVQIVAQGSFIDPDEGLRLNAAGSGSGFIIDPTGIAVTNNHVVTGAATLEVFVNGESRNASLVASSECSDLAVIDIEGEGYPFLDWYTDPIDVGLDVFAAGYPLGDPEFTLTRGIVSKAQTSGDTSWSSVEAVIEHDASINPGNSGGPLVAEDSRVVAVNYAGARDVGQFFAIGQDTALAVVEQLRQGEPVDWIGINGEAIVFEDGTSGIWVAAVESGSPASNTGIQAGDIITTMEGLVVGTDGTMRDYCDILRTRANSAVAVEILRLETEEVLVGEINGAPLTQSFSFAQELGTETPDATAGGYDYVTISDDTGLLTVDVPAQWSQVDGRPINDSTLDVRAAADLQAYADFYDIPGMQFTASDAPEFLDATADQLLDGLTTWSDGCTLVAREPFDDGVYFGAFDFFQNCGGGNASAVVVAVKPADGSYAVRLAVQVVSDADLQAADRILSTFFVTVG
ncbi:MAG: S1C family serine protease [Actinomycetota bacterium]